MDMPMSGTSSMAMPSMTSMASATASSTMDMGGMSHGGSGGMMMGMSDMMMVFFTATNTPLYSETWTPHSVGWYAGTCVFLIILSALFRGIIAIRCNFLFLWTQWSRRRHTDILEYYSDDEVLKQKRRPWRVNEAAARAVLDTMLAGVSYLLMLAVMTMNIGYFMSILGGTFVGSFVVGGWTGTAAH